MKDLKDISRETLEIYYHGQEHEIKSLHKRLEKLTGCMDFGCCDGMNGSCVDCSYDNFGLWKRCVDFSHELSTDTLNEKRDKIPTIITEDGNFNCVCSEDMIQNLFKNDNSTN